MQLNRYNIITPTGHKRELIMGDWLEEGEYHFGKVVLINKLSDSESKEHLEIEQSVYDIWYDTILTEQ